MNGERLDYWLSVGAQPSDRVNVLIKKYGAEGTQLAEHQAALDRLRGPKVVPDAGPAEVCPETEEGSGSQRSARGPSRAARRRRNGSEPQ